MSKKKAPPTPPGRELLTLRDVVREFGFVSESAVRNLTVTKEIPYHRLGARFYFLRAELVAHFKALPGCSAAEARKIALKRAA